MHCFFVLLSWSVDAVALSNNSHLEVSYRDYLAPEDRVSSITLGAVRPGKFCNELAEWLVVPRW